MTPENQRDEDYPNDAETQEWMNASLGVPEKLGDRPIEEFIRNAGITVERDGEIFIEIVLNTVYELERRFSAQRQSWEKEKAWLEERVKYLEAEKSNLKDALETAETQHGVETEATDYIFKRCDELRAENYRLKAENEMLKNKDFVVEAVKQVEASDAMYRTQCQIIKQKNDEITRLTAALGAAQEDLRKVEHYFAFPEEYDSPDCASLHCKITDALSDPTGSLAFESWKAMEAVVEAARKTCACGARDESPDTHPHVISCELGKALEKLDGGK